MGQHRSDTVEHEPQPYVKGLLDGVGLVCLLILLVIGVSWLLF